MSHLSPGGPSLHAMFHSYGGPSLHAMFHSYEWTQLPNSNPTLHTLFE